MSEHLKSTTLELTINPGYVKDWDTWSALRELIQNALDAHDQGFEMSISRGTGVSKPIKIRNAGVSLSRSTLLLGTTSKDSGEFRGKFGEGMKLALLVLARTGAKVQVFTGADKWVPELSKSDAFGDTLLKIRVSPRTYANEVEVQIHGVSDAEWQNLNERLINIPGLPKTKLRPTDMIDAGKSKVLLSENFKGKLFSRGICVGMLPDQYAFGYDLPGVELDRDRKMADPWSLRFHLAEALALATESGKIPGETLIDILGRDTGEAMAIAARYDNIYKDKDALSKNVAKAFHEKHGDDAIPVSSMAESLEADRHQLKGRMVSKAIKFLVEKEDGTLEDRMKLRRMDAMKLYSVDELTPAELENLLWATRLTSIVEPAFTLDRLQVVDFYADETACGTYNPQTGLIRVAKRILVDRRELLATVVHETAHGWGNDGSVSHERKIEQIFADIAIHLSADPFNIRPKSA